MFLICLVSAHCAMARRAPVAVDALAGLRAPTRTVVRCDEHPFWSLAMTLCPIALAVTCKKCPAFAFCPLKTVIGDYRPEDKAPGPVSKSASAKRGPKRAK
jgi:hypothetical protein